VKYNEQENEYIDIPTKIKKENYSFGPVYTIYYDIQFSIILHLEDIEAINSLEDGEEYRFIEETNKRYLATRQGDFIFFDNPKNGTIIKVPLSELEYDENNISGEALSPNDMDLLLSDVKKSTKGLRSQLHEHSNNVLNLLKDKYEKMGIPVNFKVITDKNKAFEDRHIITLDLSNYNLSVFNDIIKNIIVMLKNKFKFKEYSATINTKQHAVLHRGKLIAEIDERNIGDRDHHVAVVLYYD